MAEHVKRRVNAARVAVAFAAAGVIAGGAATASGRPDPVPPNSVGSQEVRNGTLLWKDLKDGEVYSKDQVAEKFLKIDAAASKFLKIDDANEKFLKIDDASNTYIKGEALNGYIKQSVADSTFLKIEDAANTYVKGEALNGYIKLDDANNTFLKIDDANEKFLKIDDAAVKYLKIEDAGLNYLKIADAGTTFLKIDDANQKFLKIDDAASTYIKQGSAILGDGSVRTGAVSVPDGVEDLIKLDRVVGVAVDNNGALPAVQLTAGDKPVTWAGDGKGGTIPAGQTGEVDFDADNDTQVLQLTWDGDGKAMVGTLSISMVGSQAFGQILISGATG
jgi:hypothetical protein